MLSRSISGILLRGVCARPLQVVSQSRLLTSSTSLMYEKKRRKHAPRQAPPPRVLEVAAEVVEDYGPISSVDDLLDVILSKFKIVDALVQVGRITYEDAIRMISMFSEELIAVGEDGIRSRIDALVAAGVGAPRDVSRAVKKCPALLFGRSPAQMLQLSEALGGFFSRKQASTLIARVPQILLCIIEEVEQKYEYVFYQMGIDGRELSECGPAWIDHMTVEDIQGRHQFLLATGKYVMPDPKKPQLKFDNPSLTRILDTNEEVFATQVAGVTLEEWIVYKSLRVKQAENEKKTYQVDPATRGAKPNHDQSTDDMREMCSSEIEQVFAAFCNQTDGARKMSPEQMSINEHLSSMPMPWFQNPEADMLAMSGGPHPPSALGIPGMLKSSQDLQNNNNTRCTGSSSGVSSHSTSSSCSPITSADLLSASMRLNESHAMAGHLPPNLSDIIETLKSEPYDPSYLMSHIPTPSSNIPDRHPMQVQSSFSTSSDVSNRQSMETPKPHARRSRSSHDIMFKCQFCPKKWFNEKALHSHMNECRTIRSHSCQQCGRRFKARGGLQQHMRIHSNDKPYTCQFCNKRFTQKSHVDQHERIHTNSKPFICSFCGRAFRQRSQQLGHESTHSSGSHQLATATTTPTASSTTAGTGTSATPSSTSSSLTSSLAAAMMNNNNTQQSTGFGQISNDLLGNLDADTVLDPTSSHAISNLLALRQNQPITTHHQHQHTIDFGNHAILNGLHHQ